MTGPKIKSKQFLFFFSSASKQTWGHLAASANLKSNFCIASYWQNSRKIFPRFSKTFCKLFLYKLVLKKFEKTITSHLEIFKLTQHF